MAVSSGTRFRVLERDGFRCIYCGASSHEKALQVDHRIAASKGGAGHIGNLVTSCADCNRGKSNRELADPPAIGSTVASLQFHVEDTCRVIDEALASDEPRSLAAITALVFEAYGSVNEFVRQWEATTAHTTLRKDWSEAQAMFTRSIDCLLEGNNRDASKFLFQMLDMVVAFAEGLSPVFGCPFDWERDEPSRLHAWCDRMAKQYRVTAPDDDPYRIAHWPEAQ